MRQKKVNVEQPVVAPVSMPEPMPVQPAVQPVQPKLKRERVPAQERITTTAEELKELIEVAKEKDRLDELKNQQTKEAAEKEGRKKGVNIAKTALAITNPLSFVIMALLTVGIFIKGLGHGIQRVIESIGQSFKSLWKNFSE